MKTLSLALFFLASLGGNFGDDKKPDTKAAGPLQELKVVDKVKSKSKVKAEEGDYLVVLYKGTLRDGKVFDQNDGKEDVPFVFQLGKGQVIKGWDQGMAGMAKGAKRRLEIPAKLAYGEAGAGPDIAPNTDIFFDVELLEVVKGDSYDTFTSTTTKPGKGEPAKKGDKISVHYTGKFLNGKKFDSSLDRNQQFVITLGAGMVIKGWDEGLMGIKKGEKRTLRIMPGAAYGSRGAGGVIPPNMPIEFDVECFQIGENP